MSVCVCVYSEEDSAGDYMQSVQHVLEEVSEVWALESVVAHLELGYSGTCDCIATYRCEETLYTVLGHHFRKFRISGGFYHWDFSNPEQMYIRILHLYI